MGQLIIIDGPEVFLQLLEYASFIFGYFMKGLVLAVISEILWRPLARKFKKKLDYWEREHPIKYQYVLHFIENHSGRHPSKCDHHRCRAVNA